MGLNLDQLRSMVYGPIGIPENSVQLPFTSVDLFLNRAFWEIQNKFPFREKEVISNFNTTAAVRNYDVSFPTEAVIHIAIERQDIDISIGGQMELHHQPLIQITRDQYEQLYANNTDQYAMPERYVREGCIIRLWPTPDTVYLLVIKRLVALTDLSDTNTGAVIPQVWHEIIGYGGLWRAYYSLGDIARGNATKALTAELINTIVPTQVKEEQSNSQLAGVSVPGLEY